MKPFLLLATRAEDEVADAECAAFLRFGGLRPDQLVRVRLESAPLDDLLPGLDLREFSGVLIGGSPFTTSDPASAKSPTQLRVERDLDRVVGEVLKFDVPFLGACYGIGTLGIHLGGVVDATWAEPVSAVDVTLTAAGEADPLLAGVPRVFRAFVGHKEALLDTPPGATLLAGSPGCPVQMFKVGEHQYATQFHPELDVPGVVGRVRTYRHSGYFAPDELDDLIAVLSTAEVTLPPRILANFVSRYAG